MYDVVIIGAGVVGSAVARELSRYQLKIAVLEKNYDVCFETSGRNSGVVHAGFAYDLGTLKAKYCLKGNQMMEALSEELSFTYKKCGKILVGFSKEDYLRLEQVLQQGKENGVQGLRLIDKEELKKISPYAEGEFALYSPNSGIVDPFLFTIALAENAFDNGVDFFFEQEVKSIRYEGNYEIKTTKSVFKSRWVINAAGLGAKKIAEMVGIEDYKVIGSKGEYIILDQKLAKKMPMPIYPVPSNLYMGIHLTNTTEGNILIGPDARNTEILDDYGTNAENIGMLIFEGKRIWPHIQRRDFIRQYTGILPKRIDHSGNIMDFTIECRDQIAPKMIQLIGIESPGLTAAVPIAKHVVQTIKEVEDLINKSDFNGRRKSFNRFSLMSDEQKRIAVQKNSNYGELICRCERVSKAEILYAINNPLGRISLLSIKYRTRAMMGRCQGGYCQAKIVDMLMEEKGISEQDILYSGEHSSFFVKKLRGDAND